MAALMRGRRVITVMRMDVFIMNCVSHSNPPFHVLVLSPSCFEMLSSESAGPVRHLDVCGNLLSVDGYEHVSLASSFPLPNNSKPPHE